MSINAAEIPQIEGDLDAVDGAGKSLTSAGRGFADTGSDVHATWQGLSGVYSAPEAGELFAATAPVSSDSATIGTDVGSVGSALSAYAAEVRPIQAELQRLRIQAEAFNSSIAGDEDWNEDEGKVNEKNGILQAVNAAVAAWQAAERTCASAINATYGGVQYRADDGDGTAAPDEYGYTAEMLDGATAGEQGVPWGQASEVDKPWYEDAWNSVVSFGKGLVVDGLWGAVRGLGTMVGVDGWDAAKQAWAGMGKLALALNPVTAVIDQTVGLPGMERGEAGATALAAGKALIAYDMWGQDPARAAGAVTGNVIGAVIGTKGAGAAIKGSGTVAKVGAATSTAFPRAAELAARFGGKVSNVKVNLATSMSKLELPRFGPQPAFAGAGGFGGRGGAVFDVTPGSRSSTTASGMAARIDDGAAGSRGPVAAPADGARSGGGSAGARVDDGHTPAAASPDAAAPPRPVPAQYADLGEPRRLDSGGKGSWVTELNRPEPNRVYIVDDRHLFVTDDSTRVTHAETTLDTTPGDRNTYQQGKAGGAYRLELDQGGHLVATQFGGPGERINLVAMDRALNGAGKDNWYAMENSWRDRLQANPDTRIDVTIDIDYPGASTRPDQFRVQYSVDGGEPVRRRFRQ